MAIYNLYKPLGWTPLETINKLRENTPELSKSSITYAGRLDPMAEGVLLALTDSDRFLQEKFLNFSKTYVATFLFGYETDTYDALGLAKFVDEVNEEQLALELNKLEGYHILPFPPYSSYKVQGKPLVFWAREGRLNEITIPLKEMNVLETNNIQIRHSTSHEILEQISHNINLVQGDFRQEIINSRWIGILKDNKSVTTVSLSLKVSSGTYIRSIAHELGLKLNCGGMLLNLLRTQVGEYSLIDSTKVV